MPPLRFAQRTTEAARPPVVSEQQPILTSSFAFLMGFISISSPFFKDAFPSVPQPNCTLQGYISGLVIG